MYHKDATHHQHSCANAKPGHGMAALMGMFVFFAIIGFALYFSLSHT
ncbi:hypothetical protein [Kordiimonas marina]|nr:hypothetical protein [Kordiimonas marina]MCJ9428673.1 hypothetical protein [Kordiimonas marina]